jgi:hypothetical protein
MEGSEGDDWATAIAGRGEEVVGEVGMRAVPPGLRRVHWSKEASSLRAFPFCSTPRIKLMSYWIIGAMVEAIIR